MHGPESGKPLTLDVADESDPMLGAEIRAETRLAKRAEYSVRSLPDDVIALTQASLPALG